MAAPDAELRGYFPRHVPRVRARRHTCVGLGLEVLKRLRSLEPEYPGLGRALALVSCDENVPDAADYAAAPGPRAFLQETEKDHVLVALRVRVDGRAGVFLADLGYHVARAVTVMRDRAYPHTGWFTQSDEPHCRKEYMYQLNAINESYVEWHERETRGSVAKEIVSLVYVARPYLTAVSVTEKRNLIWDMRSLLARDPKGRLTAGVYFPLRVRDQQFTMFFTDAAGKQRKKYKFETFLQLQTIPDETVAEVERCGEQLRMREGALLALLSRLAAVVCDTEFIQEVLDLNAKVVELSAGT